MEHPWNPGRRAAFRTSLLASLAAASAPALVAAPSFAQGRRGAAARPPLAGSSVERRILAVIEDVYRNHRYLSVPEEDGRLLRLLAESIGAKHVVELGTSTGYSGLWLLLAISKTGGRLTTYEIDRGRHQMARDNFDRAGVPNSSPWCSAMRTPRSPSSKNRSTCCSSTPTRKATSTTCASSAPLVRIGGLIVAHNMASPPPDPRYVDAVTTNPALETVFLNMHEAGVGVTLKKR